MLIGTDVEKLFTILLAYFEAVSSPLELASKRSDIASVGIENENGWVIPEFRYSLMNNIEKALSIDCDIVGGLPGGTVG